MVSAICAVAWPLLVPVVAAVDPAPVPLAVSATFPAQAWQSSADVPLRLPGEQCVYLKAPQKSWTGYHALEFDVNWPADAPTDGQVLVHFKDWEFFWYQNLLPGFLQPGKVAHLRVDLNSEASGWVAKDHHGAWNLRVLTEPKEVGITVFSKTAGTGGLMRVGNVRALPKIEDRTPPAIRSVRANLNSVACYDKFEVTFELPDRYANPFDPEQVSVTADFVTPRGETLRVDGFFGANYYRVVEAKEERFFPQGRAYWRVRFCPVLPGTYRYTLRVKDSVGMTTWGPATFTATPPRLPGFVRISAKDPRYFEFGNGSAFFPIGHNIRSPFDTRMDWAFPWAQRWPAGSTVYTRYFKTMREHQENFAEVWSAAWSLGLEWSPQWRGYHGIGQYNMINAWEFDRLLEEAEENGIYVNFVMLNHGKYSGWCDPEWAGNPFNIANGGYLRTPFEFFTDERAQRDFKNQMRYIIARWGYSTRIFAWELWSELNLAGNDANSYRQPECVEWHRLMARAVREMDPYGHLIATHVSGDYTVQNPDIISLPEMTHCPVDAYHGSRDPIHIVSLLRQTAAFNTPYDKPVIVTEFGGSWAASDLKHLDCALHAALWASTCLPLAATPLFWWWQVIDEENFYPKYLAIARFMKGEDRRDPALLPVVPVILQNGAMSETLDAQCLKNRRRALGWIFLTGAFQHRDPAGTTVEAGVSLELTNLQDGSYDVEFWDTTAGRPVAKSKATTQYGSLSVPVPAFARDIAFKVKPAR